VGDITLEQTRISVKIWVLKVMQLQSGSRCSICWGPEGKMLLVSALTEPLYFGIAFPHSPPQIGGEYASYESTAAYEVTYPSGQKQM